MTTTDAHQPDSPSVIRSTAAATAFVVGWYSLPDYVRSRSARAALKAAGLVVFTALSAREAFASGTAQETVALLRGRRVRPAGTPGLPTSTAGREADREDASTGAVASQAAGVRHALDDDIGPDDGARAAALAGAGLAVVGGTVLTVVVERWLFRRDERRASEGVRRPHTRSGLLLGVLTALVAVPDVLRSRAIEGAAGARPRHGAGQA